MPSAYPSQGTEGSGEEALLCCTLGWLLVLLYWHVAALLRPDNVSDSDIQRLGRGEGDVVGQQGGLLHDGAVLVSMGMCIPRGRETDSSTAATLQAPRAVRV